MARQARGFTLIEIMIGLVIVGILTAVALPAYNNYIIRARVAEAATALSGLQPTAEQYWFNNRSYINLPLPGNSATFTYSIAATDTSYVAKATGAGSMAGFVYTINQGGARATLSAPTGWTTSTTCWVDRKSGLCTE